MGGTITDPDDAITATGNVTIDNAGTVISTGGANDDSIFHSAGILTLINRATGTITGGDDGVAATTLTSLTNSGKITGGNFAIHETAAAYTLLTLLSGSDIFGAIDLGGGLNTLVVGNGLSIDHLFSGTCQMSPTVMARRYSLSATVLWWLIHQP